MNGPIALERLVFRTRFGESQHLGWMARRVILGIATMASLGVREVSKWLSVAHAGHQVARFSSQPHALYSCWLVGRRLPCPSTSSFQSPDTPTVVSPEMETKASATNRMLHLARAFYALPARERQLISLNRNERFSRKISHCLVSTRTTASTPHGLGTIRARTWTVITSLTRRHACAVVRETRIV